MRTWKYNKLYPISRYKLWLSRKRIALRRCNAFVLIIVCIVAFIISRFFKSNYISDISVFFARGYIPRAVIFPQNVEYFSKIPKNHIKFNRTINVYQKEPPQIGEITVTCSLCPFGKKLENIHDFTSFYFPSYHFYCLTDVYYRSAYNYCTENYSYILDYNHIPITSPIKVKYSFDKVIAFAGSFSQLYYGDFVFGGLIRLVYYPKEIFTDAIIANPNNELKSYLYEVLDYMNITNYNVAYIKREELIFAKELYTIVSYFGDARKIRKKEEHQGFHGEFSTKFVNLIYDRNNLHNVIPTIYAMQNRDNGMRMYLSNAAKITKMVQKEHPDINFTTIPHSFDSITSSAVLMSTVKWLFTPTGSNCAHCLFMKPGGCVLVYMCNFVDYPVLSSLIGRRLWVVGFTNQLRAHSTRRPITIRLRTASKYVNRSLEILNQQHL